MANEMLKLEIDNQNVQSMLKDLLRKVDDLRPFMQEAAGILHDAVEENFEQEGRPKWKALAPATIKQRGKKGYWPGRILQVSGQLAASIDQQYGSDFALVGTNKVYAGVHQLGINKTVSTKKGSRKMNIPARPYLNVTDRDLQKILDAGEEYLRPR